MNILIDGQVLSSPEINRGIGIYTKNVIREIVNQNHEDNWFIVAGDITSLKRLPENVMYGFIPILDSAFRPDMNYSKEEQYTNALLDIIDRFRIDVYWNPNPLMVNVLFPQKQLPCRFVATVYDLIPHIFPVPDWPEFVKSEYFRRITYIKENAVNVMCISKATEADVYKYLGESMQTVVIPLAADPKIFHRRTSLEKEAPYIVFTGGFDYRKNMTRAVRSFTKALSEHEDDACFQKVNFYLVCSCTEKQRLLFYKEIKAKYRNRIILTGFIPDEELADLYAHAAVFFFPTLYEGFGLPILEAMLGGAYILSADNSSLPEVCGGHALLCNANDEEDMASKLYEAYTNSLNESSAERESRQSYALTFSWEKTARQTNDVLKQDVPDTSSTKRYKLALVTPWPPQQSGIASYVYKLVPELKRYFDIDIFVDNTYVKEEFLYDNPSGAVYNLCELDTRFQEYDHIIYHIGNNKEFHTGVYQYLRRYPGIVEIHDFDLSAFFYHSFYLTGNKQTFRRALTDGYGAQGGEYYSLLDAGAPFDGRFPMEASAASIAVATIFHNAWSVAQSQSKTPIYLVPLASFKKEADGIIDELVFDNIKRKIGYRPNDFVIGMFGFINKNKRYEVVLRAFKKLTSRYDNLRLVFWGQENSNQAPHLIRKMNLSDDVSITGYLDKASYEAGLSMTDIVINLRYPSMGESSATLCEALQYGKPVIVSAVNQYLEFPDSVCWKLPVYEDIEKESEHLYKMLDHLVSHPETKNQLGNNAYHYASSTLSPDRIAKRYYDIVCKEAIR